MKVAETFKALKTWIPVAEANLKEGKELEVRYEQATVPIRVLRLGTWKDTLLILEGIDSEQKTRAVMTSSPAIQLEVRTVKAEDPGTPRRIGFSTSGD